MDRFAVAVVALYGLVVSQKASRNIRTVRAQAAHGDKQAQQHFTQTRYARLFGVLNSDLGMMFYGALCLSAATGAMRRRWVARAMVLSSAGAILTSIYLLWALFRLRIRCPICLQGHAANLATAALLLWLQFSRYRDTIG